MRWPDGAICPHCGSSDPDKLAKIEGTKKSHRPGLYYCNDCKGQFTVTVGTVFECSKVPLTKWWMAAHMMNSGKNGVSAHENHRALGVADEYDAAQERGDVAKQGNIPDDVTWRSQQKY